MNLTNEGIILSIFASIVIIMAVLVFFFRKRFTKRRMCIIIASMFVVTVMVCGVALITLHSSFKREYLADLRIDLVENQGVIIIREWTFLQGGGADIYYENDGKEILIGETTADDGYCPFQKGQYTLDENDGKVIISWAFFNDAKKDWRMRTFILEP